MNLRMFGTDRPLHMLVVGLCMLFIVTTQGIAADAPKTGEQPEAVSETADAPKIAEQPKAATLEEITVHGERLKDNIKITPGAIVINPEDYKKQAPRTQFWIF